MVEERVRNLLEVLETCTDEERLNVFSKLTEHYCVHCGRYIEDQFSCHCNNDE